VSRCSVSDHFPHPLKSFCRGNTSRRRSLRCAPSALSLASAPPSTLAASALSQRTGRRLQSRLHRCRCAPPSLHHRQAASQYARVGVASPPRIPPSVFGQGCALAVAAASGCRPGGAARRYACRCLSGRLFGVARSGFRRVLGLRRFRCLGAGFPLGPAWLGAPLPGWAVLAAACPGFFWLAPIC